MFARTRVHKLHIARPHTNIHTHANSQYARTASTQTLTTHNKINKKQQRTTAETKTVKSPHKHTTINNNNKSLAHKKYLTDTLARTNLARANISLTNLTHKSKTKSKSKNKNRSKNKNKNKSKSRKRKKQKQK